MSDETDALREVFLEVTGERTLTERQVRGPSRAPIEESDRELERAVDGLTREDGLEDAVDADFAESGIAEG